MRKATSKPTSPKPRAGAELILRQGFLIDASSGGLHAVPELVVLGNHAGLRYLADLLAHAAEQCRKASAHPEPQKLPRGETPLNTRLCDDLEIVVAGLTPANRRAMFKRFGIDMKSRQRGSLFERYQEVAAQFSRLTSQMNRENSRREQSQRRADDTAGGRP
jgi:hypothetical protein